MKKKFDWLDAAIWALGFFSVLLLLFMILMTRTAINFHIIP